MNDPSWKWMKPMNKNDAFVAGFSLGFAIPCILFGLGVFG